MNFTKLRLCIMPFGFFAAVAFWWPLIDSPSNQIQSDTFMQEQKVATPESNCGCSDSASSNVPCLVSAFEDHVNRHLISKPEPIYPEGAKTAKVSGEVSVGVIIDKTGKVIFAWLEKGNALLGPAAVEAAYKMLCKPTLLSGRPVNVKSVMTYKFVLPKLSSV